MKPKRNVQDATLKNLKVTRRDIYRLQEAFCTLCAWLVNDLGHEGASELIHSVYKDNRINKKKSFKRAKKKQTKKRGKR